MKSRRAKNCIRCHTYVETHHNFILVAEGLASLYKHPQQQQQQNNKALLTRVCAYIKKMQVPLQSRLAAAVAAHDRHCIL